MLVSKQPQWKPAQIVDPGRLAFLSDIGEIIRIQADLFRALAYIRRKIFIVDLGLTPSGTTRVAMESLLLRNKEGSLKCI